MSEETLAPKVICREIREEDLDGVADLLTRGFKVHGLADWQQACRLLAERQWPKDYPRFGWMLEAEGRVVGCILTIYTTLQINGLSETRCNPSSWFVEEKYRGHSMRLTRLVANDKEIMYLNPTPNPGTYGMLKHLGFAPYCKGRFMAFAAANPIGQNIRVREFDGDAVLSAGLLEGEAQLLADHRAHGCLSLICDTGDELVPFVFIKRQRYLPYAQLIYCRRASDIIRFAGSIGRFLACRGIPLLVIDSNGPIRGLVGRFFDNRPKFFKGARRPRLGDLAYTELALMPSLFHSSKKRPT